MSGTSSVRFKSMTFVQGGTHFRPKFLCSSERKFPEVIKTFVSIAFSFWDALYCTLYICMNINGFYLSLFLPLLFLKLLKYSVMMLHNLSGPTNIF